MFHFMMILEISAINTMVEREETRKSLPFVSAEICNYAAALYTSYGRRPTNEFCSFLGLAAWAPVDDEASKHRSLGLPCTIGFWFIN